MSNSERVKQALLQDFGEAYRGFGLSKLMGRVVGLLLFAPEPLSLDEIADNLEMSKGPISQITRRLRERQLIRKVWKPGSRKDYYEAMPEIFENAFRNNLTLIENNIRIAQRLRDSIRDANDPQLEALGKRMVEMEAFYIKMQTNFEDFLQAWIKEREDIVE